MKQYFRQMGRQARIQAGLALLACMGMTAGFSCTQAQMIMDYGQPIVPSLGEYGYGYNPMLAQPVPQQPWMPYGAPPPPANTPPDQSAATPTTTFGLPKADAGAGQTIFPAPPTYINDSLPTTSHDHATIHEEETHTSPSEPVLHSYTLDMLRDPDRLLEAQAENGLLAGKQRTIRQEAWQVGRSAGYNDELVRMERKLEKQAGRLDQEYRFSRLKNGYIVPPVITLMDRSVQECGNACLHLAVGTYHIEKEAYVSTHMPSWRDYLFLPPLPVRTPRDLELTKGRDRKLWKQTVEKAWEAGKGEARAALSVARDRLQQDYMGMQRYYDLERQGVVTMADVSVENRNGVIYVNGRTASRADSIIHLGIAPTFQNRAALIASDTSMPFSAGKGSGHGGK